MPESISVELKPVYDECHLNSMRDSGTKLVRDCIGGLQRSLTLRSTCDTLEYDWELILYYLFISNSIEILIPEKPQISFVNRCS
jgi:hypothetical protein